MFKEAMGMLGAMVLLLVVMLVMLYCAPDLRLWK